MKTLATHPELVRAWLLAQAGLPLSPPPPLPEQRQPQRTGPVPPPAQPSRH